MTYQTIVGLALVILPFVLFALIHAYSDKRPKGPHNS
jgi:hypothetical protein